MIFVNFKTYLEASAEKAIRLAKICQEVEEEIQIKIVPCVQALDLPLIVEKIGPVWVQHIDPVSSGQNTGYVTAEAIRLHGGIGTILNHSEHPLSFENLKKAIILSKKQNLQTLVLVSQLEMVAKIDFLKPDYLGLEEPSFIGGRVAMVRSEKYQEVIKSFVAEVKFAKPIVGAGITEKQDIIDTLSLGVKGVLVSSAVVLAANPKFVLKEMAEAFKAS